MYEITFIALFAYSLSVFLWVIRVAGEFERGHSRRFRDMDIDSRAAGRLLGARWRRVEGRFEAVREAEAILLERAARGKREGNREGPASVPHEPGSIGEWLKGRLEEVERRFLEEKATIAEKAGVERRARDDFARSAKRVVKAMKIASMAGVCAVVILWVSLAFLAFS